jgi:hypothetical protein
MSVRWTSDSLAVAPEFAYGMHPTQVFVSPQPPNHPAANYAISPYAALYLENHPGSYTYAPSYYLPRQSSQYVTGLQYVVEGEVVAQPDGIDGEVIVTGLPVPPSRPSSVIHTAHYPWADLIRNWSNCVFVSEVIMMVMHLLVFDIPSIVGSVLGLTASSLLICQCCGFKARTIYPLCVVLWGVSCVLEGVALILLILSLSGLSSSSGGVASGTIVLVVWVVMYAVLILFRSLVLAFCVKARRELISVAPEPT